MLTRLPHAASRAAFAFLSLASLAVLASCRDSAAPTLQSQPLSFTVDGDSARSGGLITVILRDTITRETLDGVLDQAPLTFARRDDSTFVGITPELSAGVRTLRLSAGDRSGEATVNVRVPLEIANPVAAITASLDAMIADMPESPMPGFSAEMWADYRYLLDSLVTDAKAKLATATPAEQMAAARLVASLSSDNVGLGLVPVSMLGNQANLLTSQCAAGITAAAISVGTALTGLGVLLTAAIPGVSLVTAPLGVALFLKSVPAVNRDVPAMFGACANQEVIGFTFGSASQVTAAAIVASSAANVDLVFTGSAATRIHPTETIRPFSREDAADPAFSRVTTLIDALRSGLARLPDWILRRLPAVPPSPSSVAPSESEVRSLDPMGVRIESVTPASFTVSAAVEATALALTVETASETDSLFSFHLVSTSNPAIKRAVTAVLRRSGYMARMLTGHGGQSDDSRYVMASDSSVYGPAVDTAFVARWRNGTRELLSGFDQLVPGRIPRLKLMDANAHGEVIGWYRTDSTDGYFIWSNGTARRLSADGFDPVTQQDYPTPEIQEVTAINDFGEMAAVGYAGEDTISRAIVLSRDGTIRRLPFAPQTISASTTDINNAGVVVGSVSADYYPGKAAIWRNGTVTVIHPPGATWSHALAVSDSGHVVILTSPNALYLWRDGAFTRIESVELARFHAFDVNVRGQVVGYDGNRHRAFVWQAGALTLLPELGIGSTATSIGNDGIIVGFAILNEPGSPRVPVVWEPKP